MEEFCSDVIEKVCLNHEMAEVEDVTNGVEQLINRFVGLMMAKFPDFNIKHVTPCGSMAEKTRIKGKEELEYDYIIEMESWPRCGELKFQRSCEGSMQPLYKVSTDDYVCLSTYVITAFRDNLWKSIKKSCKKFFCPSLTNQYQDNNKKIANGCQSCSVYMTTGCLRIDIPIVHGNKIHFIFEPKTKASFIPSSLSSTQIEYYSDNIRNVFVDIHPVLIFSPEQLRKYNSEKRDVLTKVESNCYLFPNTTLGSEPSCDGRSGCWRISHYDIEVQILQQTCQLHRNMYMILKFIKEKIFNFSNLRDGLRRKLNITSYEIKTAVLHHIKNCNLPQPDLGRCLLSTIKLLSICFQDELLPNIGSGFNIFLFETNHYNSSRERSLKLIGYIFEVLHELLTTGLKTGTAGVLTDLESIQSEVTRAFRRSKHTIHIFEIETHVQACKNVLSEYVHKRIGRTAESLVYEFTVKMHRYNRLSRLLKQNSQMNKLSEDMKRKVKDEMKQLGEYENYPFTLYQNYRLQVLKGCYI